MSSTLLKQIRKTKTKEQYLTNLIDNLENLIKYCSKQTSNNVNIVFLEESGGDFIFFDNVFEEIKNHCDINSSEFLFEQNSLNYANILWEIIVKIKYSEGYRPSKMIFNLYQWEFEYSGEFFSAVSSSISESKCYFINFNKKNKFQFSDEKYLIDTIDYEYLSNLFYLYQNSKTLDEKESHLSTICKKTVFLFMEKDSPTETFEFIKLKIGNKKTLLLCGQMHGYFRHTSNDSSGKEAQEWASFDNYKKEEICKEIFVDLLYIFSFLRIKNLLPEIK